MECLVTAKAPEWEATAVHPSFKTDMKGCQQQTQKEASA